MSHQSPIRQTLHAVAGPLGWVAGFSAFLNLTYLAAPLYMMQVYDRVMHSRSTATLLYLTLAVTLCFVVYAVLDGVRARVLAGVSDIVEDRLGRALLVRLTTANRDSGPPPLAAHLSRDLDTVRQFAAGTGALAFVDLPWAPLYIGVIAMLHPALGLFAIGAAVVLTAISILGERVARQPMKQANAVATRAYQFGEAVTRYADCARTMGLGATLTDRWRFLRGEMLAAQNTASERAAVLGAIGKCARLFFQSAILGLGAYLAIHDELSGGAIFAGSLLLGRALAPVEAIIAAWRPILAAREALGRIRTLTEGDSDRPTPVRLPQPAGDIEMENVSWTPPGALRPAARGVSMRIQAGAVLTIVGPSAAGKSTVARLLAGAPIPDSGVVRLDGADLATWDKTQLGAAIGYLPQDVALFPGTIRDNIARFGDATDEAVIAAAKAAHAHETIVRLPMGYRTVLDPAAASLSGGQKQRIALARALLGDPAVVILDEPNANLDSEGEAALTECVRGLKERKRTVVMITHRVGLVRASDHVATMDAGVMTGVQTAAEFLARQMPAAVPAPSARLALPMAMEQSA